MENLYGTYRVFTPSDESAVGFGEIEIVVGVHGLKLTIAGGLGLDEEAIPSSELRKMTADEIAADFNADANLAGVEGIIAIEATPETVMDYVRLLFLPAIETDENSQECVLLRGFMGEEVFGPSVLFTPSQLAAGRFEEAIAEFEKLQEESDVVPRIEYGGMTARDHKNAGQEVNDDD